MSEVQRFGSYILLKKIAAGGMAELYKAKKSGEKGFEKLFAVKMILPHLAMNEDFITMLVDEAKVAALLDHQNIAHIYDLGKIEGSYCIVMEYVRGRDLRKVMVRAAKAGRPITTPHACHVAASVLAGLSSAHKKRLKGADLGIVHRDISPQNILISYDGDVKIADFGIAKAATQSTETKAGVLKGKVSYMSPEQARGKAIDYRSDIFSTGVILYEMLAGRKLFQGDSELGTLKKVWAARVEPLPTSVNKDVPPELEAILLRALARDPAARYQAASEMEDALHGLMREKGWHADAESLGGYMSSLFREEMEAEVREDEELYESLLTNERPAAESTSPGPAPVKPVKMDAPPLPQPLPTPGLLQPAGDIDVKEASIVMEAPVTPAAPTRIVPEGKATRTAGRLSVAAAVLALALAGGWYGLVKGKAGQPVKRNDVASSSLPAPDEKTGVQAMPKANVVKPLSPLKATPKTPAPAGAHAVRAAAKTTEAPARPASALATVSSEPSGAAVYLDGHFAGTTPLGLSALEPGRRYEVKVVKEGYAPWKGGINPGPGAPEGLSARLVRSGPVKDDVWSDIFPKKPEK